MSAFVMVNNGQSLDCLAVTQMSCWHADHVYFGPPSVCFTGMFTRHVPGSNPGQVTSFS